MIEKENGGDALVLEHVSYRFADSAKHAYAYKDISFSLKKGEFVSLMGPSGAGKSTVLRTIAGVLKETSGTVVRNFKKPGMVFQGHGVFPWLTVLENTAFGLYMRGVAKHEREKIAREKLKEVGLEEFEARYPYQLSGGQHQRVAMARALAIEPDILLMDEPFASLDSITASSLKNDVLRLWERYGITILMVNHLIPDAIELSDRVIVMKGDPGEVEKIMPVSLPRPRDTRSKEFFAEVDRLTEVLEKKVTL